MSNPAIHIDDKIEFAYQLASNAVLCFGKLSIPLTGKEQLFINGLPAHKPYLIGVLSEKTNINMMMILRTDDELVADSKVKIKIITEANEEITWKCDELLSDNSQIFANYLGNFSDAGITKILLLLAKLSLLDTNMMANANFAKICLICSNRINPNNPPAKNSYWILPNVLYMDLQLEPIDTVNLRLLALMPQRILMANAKIKVISGAKHGLIAIFYHKNAMQFLADAQFALVSKNRLVPIPEAASYDSTKISALINYLRELPEQLRLNMRDFIANELLLNVKQDKENIIAIVKTLQSYLLPTHTSLRDKSLPFGMNIELAFPMESKGIFIAGWLHDALSLIETISVTTDLGVTIPFKSKIQHYPRTDIEQLYGDENALLAPEHAHGFVAIAEYQTQAERDALKWLSPLSLRFNIALKSGITYTIAPKAGINDFAELRSNLLNHVASKIEMESSAFKQVRIAGEFLQKQCTKRAKVQTVLQFGATVENPQVSVVIPLYKSLEYLPSQLAHFANDPFMQRAEVIYVLDSPEQEKQLTAQLRNLCQIYPISVTLLVMSHNSGYSTATNTGANHARAQHLLLLNSDIVPINNDWLERMLHEYQLQKNVGALAPKLLYEDDSIQHAGMYFALNSSGNLYENLHYYKGYPNDYPPACINREVPAVTAACLLIAKNIFDDIGGLSSDYIIGDFEDSDLCLRLRVKGLHHYYLGSEELYHFERQSMNVVSDNHSARYFLNASTQFELWSEFIPQAMKNYV